MVQAESTDLLRLKNINDGAVQDMAQFKVSRLLEQGPGVREGVWLGNRQPCLPIAIWV